MREQVEERATEILRPLLEGLTAERSVVVGSGEDAMLEAVPDHPTRISAAEKLLDRVYGRPTQATHISGPDGGPVEVLDASNPDARKMLRAALARRAPARDS